MTTNDGNVLLICVSNRQTDARASTTALPLYCYESSLLLHVPIGLLACEWFHVQKKLSENRSPKWKNMLFLPDLDYWKSNLHN